MRAIHAEGQVEHQPLAGLDELEKILNDRRESVFDGSCRSPRYVKLLRLRESMGA